MTGNQEEKQLDKIDNDDKRLPENRKDVSKQLVIRPKSAVLAIEEAAVGVGVAASCAAALGFSLSPFFLSVSSLRYLFGDTVLSEFPSLYSCSTHNKIPMREVKWVGTKPYCPRCGNPLEKQDNNKEG